MSRKFCLSWGRKIPSEMLVHLLAARTREKLRLRHLFDENDGGQRVQLERHAEGEDNNDNSNNNHRSHVAA